MEEVKTKPMKKGSKKKQPWEIVLKDRFLTNEKKENPYIIAALYFLVFFMSFLLVFMVFFQLCEVNGHSMQTYIYNGDHVLLYRNPNSYKHDDVVVITKQGNSEGQQMNIIKRVVGVPGDTLKFVRQEGNVVKLYRKSNGSEEFQEITNKYQTEPMQHNNNFSFEYDKEIEIHDGQLFVMGYNWNNSEDSRMDGAYPTRYVMGKMFIKIERGSLLEKFLMFLYHSDKAPAD